MRIAFGFDWDMGKHTTGPFSLDVFNAERGKQ